MGKIYITYFENKGLSPRAIKDVVFSEEDVVESVGELSNNTKKLILEDDCFDRHVVFSVSTERGWAVYSTRDAFDFMYRMESKGMEVKTTSDQSNILNLFKACVMAVYPKVKLNQFIELI